MALHGSYAAYQNGNAHTRFESAAAASPNASVDMVHKSQPTSLISRQCWKIAVFYAVQNFFTVKTITHHIVNMR